MCACGGQAEERVAEVFAVSFWMWARMLVNASVRIRFSPPQRLQKRNWGRNFVGSAGAEEPSPKMHTATSSEGVSNDSFKNAGSNMFILMIGPAKASSEASVRRSQSSPAAAGDVGEAGGRSRGGSGCRTRAGS